MKYKTLLSKRFRRTAIAGVLSMAMMLRSSAENVLETVQILAKSVQEQMAGVDKEAQTKKTDLVEKYSAALTALEKKLAASGSLDGILHLREERESVEKSGSTTAHNDKDLVETRNKYLKALDGIEAEVKEAKMKLLAAFSKMAKDEETKLTKALKVEDALAVRGETERLTEELSAGVSDGPEKNAGGAKSNPSSEKGMEDVFSGKESGSGLPKIKPLETIKIPAEAPPTVANPFDSGERWMQSLTVPTGKYKLKKGFSMGDRGKKAQPLVVVSPGSTWTGSDKEHIDLSWGYFVASKSKFDNLHFLPDLACNFYFKNCILNDCLMSKGGVWYGSELAGKSYLENCLIKGKFSKSINIVDTGFRIQNSVFQDITFPSMLFRKKEPASYVNNPWLRIFNCRFVKCQVPISFILLTRDCVFEDCTLTDEAGMTPEAQEWNKPIEITVYLKTSKIGYKSLPQNVTIVQKGESELKGVTIPTLTSLASDFSSTR